MMKRFFLSFACHKERSVPSCVWVNVNPPDSCDISRCLMVHSLPAQRPSVTEHKSAHKAGRLKSITYQSQCADLSSERPKALLKCNLLAIIFLSLRCLTHLKLCSFEGECPFLSSFAFTYVSLCCLMTLCDLLQVHSSVITKFRPSLPMYVSRSKIPL